ncbi:MAG: hypothetical protein KA535_03400 [Azonexus sp.]|nr:hypothetical protein [Azonexus sp.]
MSVQTIAFAAHNLTLIHDLEAQPAPRSYFLFLHGICHELHAEENEAPDALWQRVLGRLSELRINLAAQRNSLLNPRAEATCYAGELTEQSLEKLRLKHMRQHVIDGLTRETHSHEGTGSSRTAALATLSRIYGLEAPRKRIKLTTGAQ